MTDTGLGDLLQRLAALKAERGYLLPHHRMLAAHDAELLHKYDAFYTRLTLTPKTLSDREKEFVWITLLVAVREGHGTLHLRRVDAAGLSRDEMAITINLAGLAESRSALEFAGHFWTDWAPPADMERRWWNCRWRWPTPRSGTRRR